jgi:hypothetical protein
MPLRGGVSWPWLGIVGAWGAHARVRLDNAPDRRVFPSPLLGEVTPNAGVPESRSASSSTGLLRPRARAASLLGCSVIACAGCWLAPFATSFRFDTPAQRLHEVEDL